MSDRTSIRAIPVAPAAAAPARPRVDLARFDVRDMIACGAALRRIGDGAASMEDVANRVTRYLHDELRDASTDARACALVRFFKTHRFADLDSELQRFATAMAVTSPEAVQPATPCLTLLASAGEREEWNDRRRSVSHRAIPLTSKRVLEESPMIAQLLAQFGVEPRAMFERDHSLILDLAQRSYNVFYVAEALDSPFVPAQKDFVVPHGVRSVVGFGGMLPTGDLFAAILFAKTQVSATAAELFRAIALSVKLAILPFCDRVFEPGRRERSA